MVVPGVPNEADATPVEYAGFWRRFLAHIIDSVVIAVSLMLFVGLFILVPLAVTGGVNAEEVVASEGWFKLLIVVISWLYYASMESSPGRATLGKMAIGVVVTGLGGERISFGQATGRYFAKFISALPLWFGFIMAGYTPKKQALHDMIASTLVLMKPH